MESGEESPFTKWIERIEAEAIADDDADRTTTRIDVRDFIDVGRDALLAHRTQVPPDSFFFRVPLEVQQARHPWDEYILARTLVDPGPVDGGYETDLFAGLRVAASS